MINPLYTQFTRLYTKSYFKKKDSEATGCASE